jgi:hypothetical protein
VWGVPKERKMEGGLRSIEGKGPEKVSSRKGGKKKEEQEGTEGNREKKEEQS